MRGNYISSVRRVSVLIIGVVLWLSTAPALGGGETCCNLDGTCSENVSCGSCEGVCYNAGETCGDITCPAPDSACCFSDGSCQFVNDEDGCEDMLGTNLGPGTDCDPDPCGAGACCFAGQVCAVVTRAACGGGFFFGVGTNCDFNPCDGACCSANGHCKETTQTGCGGVYQGDRTSCDPNLCPQPATGACCSADDICTDNLAATSCSFDLFLGHTCSELDQVTCTPLGACCADDGDCTSQTEDDCLIAGNYLGDFTDCDPNLCPQPTGACCLHTSSADKCVVVAEAGCTGAYRGDGTTCDAGSCEGACCEATGCTVLVPDLCDPADFQGLGTTCSPDPCPDPTGACCASSESTLCQVTTEADCAGVYRGDGITCEGDACSGACCTAVGCQQIPPSICSGLGFVFHGLGRPCDPDPCQVDIGACCVNEAFCEERPQVQCNSGPFAGVGTTCSSTQCLGACCAADGACVADQTEANCSGTWTFQGICSPNPCPPPTGAETCCHLDGTCSENVSCGACDGVCYIAETCAGITCPAPNSACCLADGTCQLVNNQVGCERLGTYLGEGTDCDPYPCGTGACCACCAFGTGCDEGLTATACPFYFFLGHTCSELDGATCSALGACCASDGSCTQETQSDCSGTYQGDFTDCDPNPCPQPTGACCAPVNGATAGFTPGDCSIRTADECAALGGVFQGASGGCNPNPCPQPTGACCLAEAPTAGIGVGPVCVVMTERECIALANAPSAYKGDGTACEPNPCLELDRVDATKKGSLLVYPKIELKWDALGRLKQDTVLTIVNDYPAVHVQWYFINGDPPLAAVVSPAPPFGVLERAHRGWNWMDCQVELTEDESTYIAMSTGLPMGCQPFTTLDPGVPPGRPDPDAPPGHRMLRGYAIAFAVNAAGEDIMWNHLSGGGILIDYTLPAAWDYGAYAFQRSETPRERVAGHIAEGVLHLDGTEYDECFDKLLLDFFAVDSGAFSRPGLGVTVTLDTDLTLLPVSADLRQDVEGRGPVTTKAKFDIWNENEDFLSGTTRCITCWDQALLSTYDPPNNFLLSSLHTHKGKARINGIASEVCENCEFIRVCNSSPPFTCQWIEVCELESESACLLGVAAKFLDYTGAISGTAYAGNNVVGIGKESATILYDIRSGPDTQTGPRSKELPDSPVGTDLSPRGAKPDRRPRANRE